ncbi:MAG: hypothetical protein C0512_11550 [Flavobacterium sp.]|nr:hypothetical protein [Flavobacterium sp.]
MTMKEIGSIFGEDDVVLGRVILEWNDERTGSRLWGFDRLSLTVCINIVLGVKESKFARASYLAGSVLLAKPDSVVMNFLLLFLLLFYELFKLVVLLLLFCLFFIKKYV